MSSVDFMTDLFASAATAAATKLKLKSNIEDRTMLKVWIMISKSFQKIESTSVEANEEINMLRDISFVWAKAEAELSKSESIEIASVNDASSSLFFDTLIWRISVDWITIIIKDCSVEEERLSKLSVRNENDEAIDSRTYDSFFESSNLSFLKTFDMKKKLKRCDVIETRSMIEESDYCVRDLLLNLFDDSLFDELISVTNKKFW